MEIRIPEFCLVMMIGPTSSGKTTLARAHFADSEIVASDHCRYVMSGDGSDQSATKDAFALLRFIVGARLRNRRLTVVDATNLRDEDRRDLLTIARDNDCQTEALVMDTPRDVCLERNEAREDRQIHSGAIRRQYGTFRQGLSRTRKEGFHRIHRVKPEDTAEGILFVRERMRSDLREEKGPFDIIGDVHGCHEELMELLGTLGYTGEPPAHPEGRRAVFLGDLADRGPASDRVLETVMDMTEAGSALCVMGNHENKLVRSLRGNAVSQSHGLAQTLEQLERRDEKFRERVKTFLGRMDTHYVMDGGELAVAHAGVIQAYQNRASGRVRNFCLYGQTTGESDEWGLPVRQDWAQDYRGETLVVYGHTTVDQPGWFNNTINVDTGCVFGGSLTALRYPERELVQVSAHAVHYEPAGPPRQARAGGEGAGREREPGGEATPSEAGGGETGALHIEDVDGSRAVDTRTRGRITVRRDRAEAALETMSRFAVDPRWLVYLPPTISPTEASDLPDMLEHPAQAFDHYRRDGVESVVCEEKHMGSRGIIVIGRDEKAAARALGIRDPLGGMCYTRTGRRFFIDGETERKFMDGARAAIGKSGLWEELGTDWVVMDSEIMPWSLKAGRLLRSLYAPAGTAALSTLPREAELLEMTAARVKDPEEAGRAREAAETAGIRLDAALRYRNAYRQYCWSTDSIEGVRAAPFHILASEGRELTEMPHTWHMEMAGRLAQAAPDLFVPTDNVVVDLDDPGQVENATRWWEQLVAEGGEGMVVKPVDFVPKGKHDSVQPAIKVRGPEYLRIIYGIEYNLPGNIERMRRRNLGGKRSLALREFALGLEGLRRLVEREPLHRVHECAFAVMALESEPVDPRL